MNYFNPYPLCIDDNVTTAWKFQITEAAKTPSLAELLLRHGGELFPRFVATYTELRALPRGARRALQRRLAHSRELSAVLQEWLQQQSGRALQQKLARTLAGTALLLVLGQGASDAETITVNTTVPGIAADGKCSLIEAIINANNNSLTHPDCLVAGDSDPTEDHIVLPKKTFTLTAPYDTYYGYTGLPLITSAITIEGNGAKITRKKTGAHFRLLAVTNTGDLELQNLTLSGGSSDYGGGAIINAAQLTIANSTVTGNTGPIGGAVANYQDLTITNSTVSKNTANGAYPSGGFGGGIANSDTGTLTITNNSTITGNKASYYGGGVANSGNFNIDANTISKNSAPYGGGFANFGGVSPTQTISNSTISGNKSTTKTITYNGYSYIVGGIGAGIANLYSTLTITNSTISGNIAKGKRIRSYPYFAGGLAGGILNFGSSSNLTLSGGMVTKNTATFAGGGLLNFEGTYTYTPGTITGNKAKYGPNIYNVP
jgi:hypothetical protein